MLSSKIILEGSVSFSECFWDCSTLPSVRESGRHQSVLQSSSERLGLKPYHQLCDSEQLISSSFNFLIFKREWTYSPCQTLRGVNKLMFKKKPNLVNIWKLQFVREVMECLLVDFSIWIFSRLLKRTNKEIHFYHIESILKMKLSQHYTYVNIVLWHVLKINQR